MDNCARAYQECIAQIVVSRFVNLHISLCPCNCPTGLHSPGEIRNNGLAPEKRRVYVLYWFSASYWRNSRLFIWSFVKWNALDVEWHHLFTLFCRRNAKFPAYAIYSLVGLTFLKRLFTAIDLLKYGNRFYELYRFVFLTLHVTNKYIIQRVTQKDWSTGFIAIGVTRLWGSRSGEKTCGAWFSSRPRFVVHFQPNLASLEWISLMYVQSAV